MTDKLDLLVNGKDSKMEQKRQKIKRRKYSRRKKQLRYGKYPNMKGSHKTETTDNETDNQGYVNDSSDINLESETDCSINKSDSTKV